MFNFHVSVSLRVSFQKPSPLTAALNTLIQPTSSGPKQTVQSHHLGGEHDMTAFCYPTQKIQYHLTEWFYQSKAVQGEERLAMCVMPNGTCRVIG